jgi:hypothetical protein
MKYLEGAAIMLISNLLATHIHGLGVGMLIAGLSAVTTTMVLVFAAHFVTNLLFPKRAEG